MLLNYSEVFFPQDFLEKILKVVSATFLPICFLSQNENTCQTRENVFRFTSKAFLALEKINF